MTKKQKSIMVSNIAKAVREIFQYTYGFKDKDIELAFYALHKSFMELITLINNQKLTTKENKTLNHYLVPIKIITDEERNGGE